MNFDKESKVDFFVGGGGGGGGGGERAGGKAPSFATNFYQNFLA